MPDSACKGPSAQVATAACTHVDDTEAAVGQEQRGPYGVPLRQRGQERVAMSANITEG